MISYEIIYEIIFGVKNQNQIIHTKSVRTLPSEIVEIIKSLLFFRFKNKSELRDAVNMWCSSSSDNHIALSKIWTYLLLGCCRDI